MADIVTTVGMSVDEFVAGKLKLEKETKEIEQRFMGIGLGANKHLGDATRSILHVGHAAGGSAAALVGLAAEFGPVGLVVATLLYGISKATDAWKEHAKWVKENAEAFNRLEESIRGIDSAMSPVFTNKIDDLQAYYEAQKKVRDEAEKIKKDANANSSLEDYQKEDAARMADYSRDKKLRELDRDRDQARERLADQASHRAMVEDLKRHKEYLKAVEEAEKHSNRDILSDREKIRFDSEEKLSALRSLQVRAGSFDEQFRVIAMMDKERERRAKEENAFDQKGDDAEHALALESEQERISALRLRDHKEEAAIAEIRLRYAERIRDVQRDERLSGADKARAVADLNRQRSDLEAATAEELAAQMEKHGGRPSGIAAGLAGGSAFARGLLNSGTSPVEDHTRQIADRAAKGTELLKTIVERLTQIANRPPVPAGLG